MYNKVHPVHVYNALARRTRGLIKRIKPSVEQYIDSAGVMLNNAIQLQPPYHSIVILDDMFPLLFNAFRIAEYNYYLENWRDACVFSTGDSFVLNGDTRSFKQVLHEYTRYYPALRGQVMKFNPRHNFQGKFGYTVFINNIFQFCDFLEEHHLPFAFTLYPGGGFQLNQPRSDHMLERVFTSPWFRKVIVTQKISYEYVTSQFCQEDQVDFVYGGVVPVDHSGHQSVTKKFYTQDKQSFDICFVAFKYMPGGLDKGYDLFIEVAKILARQNRDFHFHVVGSFDQTDIPVNDLDGRITFYGTRTTNLFSKFYAEMDIILSPNAPFILGPGSFDGFPTGACIEAGLNGVAVFCTDILKQNIAFHDGQDIVIIPHDTSTICDVVINYFYHYNQLYELARKGQEAFRRVFDIEVQMAPRLSLLSSYLS